MGINQWQGGGQSSPIERMLALANAGLGIKGHFDQSAASKATTAAMERKLKQETEEYDRKKTGTFLPGEVLPHMDSFERVEPTDPAAFPIRVQQGDAVQDWGLKPRPKASLSDILGLTPGQKAIDTSFGKDATEYNTGGGKASTEKNLGRLSGAIKTLKAKPGLTGGLTTKLPWAGDDKQQDWINPEMAGVRDDIRAAVQGSLRQLLGPQFTEKEGEAIFNRAFNPRLSTEENVRRAEVELAGLRSMAQDKDAAMAYFQQKGTLSGFKPGATNIGGGPPPAPPGLSPEEQAELEALRKELGR